MKALSVVFALGCLVTASCATTSPAMTAAPTPNGLAAEEREWLHLAHPVDSEMSRSQRREVTREQRRNTGINLTGPGGASLVTKGK